MSRKSNRNRAKKDHKNKTKIPWIIIIGVLVAAALVAAAVLVLSSQPSREARKVNISSTVFITPNDTLQYLIQTHPKEEIHNDLYRLFLLEEVRYSIQEEITGGSKVAAFSLVERDSKLTPVFFFNEGWLQNRQKPELVKQALIYHEYQHYLQWKNHTYPEYMFVIGENSPKFGLQEAKLLYEGELEAYTKECEFAVSVGISDEIKVCGFFKRNDRIGFRREVARYVAEGNLQEFYPLLFGLANAGP